MVKRFFGSVFVMAMFFALVVVPGAMAEPAWITLPTAVNTDDVGTLGGVILTGLALIWGLRKLVKTINRS